MNALLASALTFAASCLASSETSCKLKLSSVGDANGDVAGVETVGDEGTEEEASLILTVVVYEVRLHSGSRLHLDRPRYST